MAGDSDPKKWDYPPHTKAKHDMLASYLDGWYPILSTWNGRLLFLDGFAGRGRYESGEEGSPIIALRRLIEHQYFPQMQNKKFTFLFVEANAQNAASLEAALAQYKASVSPWPECIHYEVINDPFDKMAQGIIEYLREQKKQLAPTFAFVDPFGYSGLPMELLADLLAYPKTEVFVNFMVGHVQRFIERDGQENAMRTLFGMDVAEILADFDPTERHRVEHLREVYARQLRERAGFTHVQSFAMINNTGNVGYYLFHGTRHPAGVKLMKAAMWKLDPGSGCTFSDRLAGKDVLFKAEPDLRPLRNNLLAHFSGKSGVTIEEVEWHAVLETPYRETHVRKALTPLAQDGTITVHRSGGSVRGFPAKKTRIDFPKLDLVPEADTIIACERCGERLRADEMARTGFNWPDLPEHEHTPWGLCEPCDEFFSGPD